jgi:cell division septum initiation protein DivIVA
MANLSQGANDIRFLAARFKGFLEAAQFLDELSSVEGAIKESKNRLAQFRQQEEDAKPNVARIIAEAEEAAQAIRNAANAAAAKLLVDARAEANKINLATEAAGIEHAHVADALDAKRRELTELSVKVEKLTATRGHLQHHDVLVAEIGHKEAHLKTLNETLAKLRSQFQA